MPKHLLIPIIFVAIAIGVAAVVSNNRNPSPTHEEPKASGSQGLIVTSPSANAEVSNPLTITGTATGGWYFEASFSAKLLNEFDQELGTAILTAQGEWMTENPVPFTGSLAFSDTNGPVTDHGTLVFEAANPSGLAENAKTYMVPVHIHN